VAAARGRGRLGGARRQAFQRRLGGLRQRGTQRGPDRGRRDGGAGRRTAYRSRGRVLSQQQQQQAVARAQAQQPLPLLAALESKHPGTQVNGKSGCQCRPTPSAWGKGTMRCMGARYKSAPVIAFRAEAWTAILCQTSQLPDKTQAHL
jgi:hypothetical protein